MDIRNGETRLVLSQMREQAIRPEARTEEDTPRLVLSLSKQAKA